jgi:hypothetical protein
MLKGASSTDVGSLPQRVERLARTFPADTTEQEEINRWLKSGIVGAAQIVKDRTRELEGIGATILSDKF